MPEDSNSSGTKQSKKPDQKSIDPRHIMLTPMQIRTFVAEIIPNST